MASELTEGLSAESLAQFKVLQKNFVAGLAVRWRAVTDAVAPRELQAQLHRLAGAAGSYGFDRMSQCALAAELLSKSAADATLALALARLEAEIKLAQLLEQDDKSAG